jgi:hypothetical protein
LLSYLFKVGKVRLGTLNFKILPTRCISVFQTGAMIAKILIRQAQTYLVFFHLEKHMRKETDDGADRRRANEPLGKLHDTAEEFAIIFPRRKVRSPVLH